MTTFGSICWSSGIPWMYAGLAPAGWARLCTAVPPPRAIETSCSRKDLQSLP